MKSLSSLFKLEKSLHQWWTKRIFHFDQTLCKKVNLKELIQIIISWVNICLKAKVSTHLKVQYNYLQTRLPHKLWKIFKTESQLWNEKTITYERLAIWQRKHFKQNEESSIQDFQLFKWKIVKNVWKLNKHLKVKIKQFKEWKQSYSKHKMKQEF